MMTFEEYLMDVLDLHVALMSEQDLAHARASYNDFISRAPSRKTPSAKTLAHQYGGKALRGTAKQKKWAHEIRDNIIKQSRLNDESIKKLVNVSGPTDYAAWWIANRDVSPGAFVAENIVSAYRELKNLEWEYTDIILTCRDTEKENKKLDEIRNYIKNCKFKFVSKYV